MDALEKNGLIAAETRKTVAQNTLVLIRSRQGKGTKKEPSRIAIGNPATVPAGRYAKEALEKRGLYAKLQGKLVLAENVRQVLDYVARGEADEGFVYKTDAMTEPKVEIVEVIPGDQHQPILYPAAVVKAAKNASAARKLIEPKRFFIN